MALTAASVIRESIGSLNLHTVTLTDGEVDDGETYVSGLSGIVGYWFNATDDPTTQTSGGVDVSESSGTFTFNCGEDDRNGTLYVLTSQPE